MTSRVIDRAKLAAVLGMLGSAHDGEVVAAGRLAEQIRAASGLSWSELLAGDQSKNFDVAPAAQTTPRRPDLAQSRRMVRECLHYVEQLTDIDRSFVEGIGPWHPRLLPHEFEQLAEIAARLGVAA